MPIGTNAAEEQFDATDSLDLGLVGSTLFVEPLGIAVEDIDILGIHVDMGEEILEHEGVVRLWMFSCQANILVHVKCHHMAE